jgi:hypothetical protein
MISEAMRRSRRLRHFIATTPLQPRASRRGAAGFLVLSQCGERPARYGEPSRFDTMPSQPSAHA